MCEFQLSIAYVVNLIIFQPFLLLHTQKSIKLHYFWMKLSRRFRTEICHLEAAEISTLRTSPRMEMPLLQGNPYV